MYSEKPRGDHEITFKQGEEEDINLVALIYRNEIETIQRLGIKRFLEIIERLGQDLLEGASVEKGNEPRESNPDLLHAWNEYITLAQKTIHAMRQERSLKHVSDYYKALLHLLSEAGFREDQIEKAFQSRLSRENSRGYEELKTILDKAANEIRPGWTIFPHAES